MASSLLIPRQDNSSTCAGQMYNDTDDRIDSNKDVFMITYRATNADERNQPDIFEAVANCCEPNEVHRLAGECVLWCEIPDQYAPDWENATANYEQDLHTNCLADMMDEMDTDWAGVSFVKEGGVSAVERPSVMGLLLLATMLVYMHT